jgi:predicted SAM-dependent methyltransferase
MPNSQWQWASQNVVGWPNESEIPQGVRLNLGCGKLTFPNEEGWVNVDIAGLEGVDVKANLFEFPWPFEDNYADYMIASHIVEHIPHQVKRLVDISDKDWDYPKGTIRKQEHELDGFFAFFAEVWRILKPGGIITVICPFGPTSMAMQDPTHTRFIVPSTFSYLGPQTSPTFDYGLPFAFESAMEDQSRVYGMDWLRQVPEQARAMALRHNWDAGHSLRWDGRKIALDSKNQ